MRHYDRAQKFGEPAPIGGPKVAALFLSQLSPIVVEIWQQIRLLPLFGSWLQFEQSKICLALENL